MQKVNMKPLLNNLLKRANMVHQLVKMQAGDTTDVDVDLNTFQSCHNVACGHMQNILTYYQRQNGMTSTQSGTSSGVIASWSGNYIKDTETFHVSSDECRLSWNTRPGKLGAMNFQIYVFNLDGSLKSVAANVIGRVQIIQL
jgi:hypothetical protein